MSADTAVRRFAVLGDDGLGLEHPLPDGTIATIDRFTITGEWTEAVGGAGPGPIVPEGCPGLSTPFYTQFVPQFGISIPTSCRHTGTIMLLNGTWLVNGQYLIGDNDA
jgi:hypothetical protein